MTAGLRERKKQQTRETIHREAMRLFAERGFEATTIADIAAAADISPRTFFSYFASKEECVFVGFDEALADFDRAMRERPPGTTAIQALRTWLVQAVQQFGGDPEREQLEARLIRESPAVAACELHHMREFELHLADAVAQDLGEPPDALRPRLVAAAAIAAMQATKDAISPTIERDPEATAAMLADPMAILDDTLRFLEGGLAALRG
jgi:AcrR family transcriptional regulator